MTLNKTLTSSPLSRCELVFLLLSSSRSERFDDFLALHNLTASAGLHTLIATHPEQLTISANRLRVVVVDGSSEADFDVYKVTAALRRLKNTVIVFLADQGLKSTQPGIEARADICLPITVDFDLFWRLIEALVEYRLEAEGVHYEDDLFLSPESLVFTEE